MISVPKALAPFHTDAAAAEIDVKAEHFEPFFIFCDDMDALDSMFMSYGGQDENSGTYSISDAAAEGMLALAKETFPKGKKWNESTLVAPVPVQFSGEAGCGAFCDLARHFGGAVNGFAIFVPANAATEMTALMR